MEEIIERIKGYVLLLDSTLEDDELLDFVIADVVDRALIYMNRSQLIEEYEAYDEEVDGVEPTTPLPEALERAMARVVVSSIQTVHSQVAKQMEVNSASDNGQSVTFSGVLSSYFSSLSDKELFFDVRTILDKFRIPTIV
jgi:hypothetical protein